MSAKVFLKCFVIGILGAAILFAMALFPSCKSAQASQDADVPAPQEPIVTYVNTAINKADGKISTIMVFNSIKEVVAIHPISRVRYNLTASDWKYNSATTELNIVLPKSVPYKITDLAFHIVGEAAFPGVFVLAGIDSSRGEPGVFFEGTQSVEGKDYSYDKNSARVTSLVPLNVDKDSFEICWATKNGEVTFSNNTQKYRDAYLKFYNAWSRKVHLRGE